MTQNKQYKVVRLSLDREALDELKALLQVHSVNNLGRAASEESSAHRRTREALKRVFEQIRTVNYDENFREDIWRIPRE